MELAENFINLLLNSGVAIAVVAYFLWKDAKLTKENTEILQQVKAMLTVVVRQRKKEGDINESLEDTM